MNRCNLNECMTAQTKLNSRNDQVFYFMFSRLMSVLRHDRCNSLGDVVAQSTFGGNVDCLH